MHTPSKQLPNADIEKDGVPLPIKSLQTVQELQLLYRISDNQPLESKLADAFVEDPAVGANSRIAKREWALQIELLNFLVLKKDWSKLFEITAKLLSESRANNSSGKILDARGADWAVWKAFMHPALLSNHK